MDEKIFRRFASTLYDQLVIVVSRGGQLVWRSEGANPDRGDGFCRGDANPLGHYGTESMNITLILQKFCSHLR